MTAAAYWGVPPWSPFPVEPDPSSDPAGMPRVLVTGSRDWNRPGEVRTALTEAWRRIGQPIVVVHGACPTGADQAADEWAWEHAFTGVVVERHPADWRAFGKAAGPRRNAEMAALGAVVCLAFPLGRSPGTRGAMAECARRGIPLRNLGDLEAEAA